MEGIINSYGGGAEGVAQNIFWSIYDNVYWPPNLFPPPMGGARQLMPDIL